MRELNIEEDLISGNSSKGEYFIEQGWQLVCSHSQNDPAFWQELEQILQTYVLQGIRMVTQKHERPELLQKMKANLKDKDAKKNYHELFIERIIPLIDSRVTLLSRVRIFASRPPVSSEEDFDKWMEHAHRREGRDW
ncbi:MAG: hypothetical protein LBO09_03915 [Candidatus Peribacteria bacterium]|nr:hypothetical protein [Candidatus Peribacteria bacterium]